MIIWNHHYLLFWKDSFDVIHCALGSTEKTTLPQVIIKGFNFFEKKNSNFFGSKGLTRDYLPYNSTVWDLKQRLYIISEVYSKAYCRDCGIIFAILPLRLRVFNRELNITKGNKNAFWNSVYKWIDSRQIYVMHWWNNKVWHK